MIPYDNHLPEWTSKVKAKDPEWDERLRQLYPAKAKQESDKEEFDDAIPF
jgi:hypothetical protein